jgi:hypothetical protein
MDKTNGAFPRHDPPTLMERHMSESAQNTPRTWDQPEGASFEQWMESRVARFSTRFETILTDRDVVSVPPGVYREEINIGDEDALMCVMLGAKKPITPTYPPEHPLAKIKR